MISFTNDPLFLKPYNFCYPGQNTPTDSVVSGRSMLDGGGGVSTVGYSRYQKPYLGWRSQENVTTDSKCGRNTPNERLARSLRRSQQSGLDRTSPFGSLNSSLAGGYGQGATSWRGSAGSSFSRSNTPGPADWFVHDSIRYVNEKSSPVVQIAILLLSNKLKLK